MSLFRRGVAAVLVTSMVFTAAPNVAFAEEVSADTEAVTVLDEAEADEEVVVSDDSEAVTEVTGEEVMLYK